MGIIKDPTSWRAGFELGLAGFSFPYSKPRRKPIAYLYNGIRLPALPEWDKEKYPYAVMCKPDSEKTLLLVGSGEWKCSSCGTGIAILGLDAQQYSYDSESGTWIYDRDFSAYGSAAGWGGMFWGNLDVYIYQTETLYLTASEPVPVYE